MSENEQGPKIIVDEDWKSQVEAEKVAAQSKPAESASDQQDQSAGSVEANALFPILISTLATQAMVAMGKIADPAEGHSVVRPDMAKHFVDTLGMLEVKTKGNLSAEEATMLDNVLHELRMAYISIGGQPAPAESSDPS